MNELSHIVDVNSGVPQSSHLALLLFILFIIDLRQAIYFSSFCMYADEVKFVSFILIGTFIHTVNFASANFRSGATVISFS